MSDYDIIVIGGGAAGLSGALALARARRSVLVLDGGRPRNAPAAGVHGFLSRDGLAPGELVALGAAEVRRYGGEIRPTEATGATRVGSELVVRTADGDSPTARRLLITTGLTDELPDIPGLRERWGRDVLHCPYCHGWEVRDQAIGVLGVGPRSVHQALLFRQWSDRVTLFLNAAPELTDKNGPSDEEWEQLAARGISVVDGPVAGLEIDGDRLSGVRLASGQVVASQAVAVLPRFVARSAVAADLGLAAVDHPSGAGVHLAADPSLRTAVPGVWVAGNVTDLMVGVIGAAAQGTFAAMHINADLMAEDTRLAVERRRRPFTAAAEAALCTTVLGDRRHGLAGVGV